VGEIGAGEKFFGYWSGEQYNAFWGKFMEKRIRLGYGGFLSITQRRPFGLGRESNREQSGCRSGD